MWFGKNFCIPILHYIRLDFNPFEPLCRKLTKRFALSSFLSFPSRKSGAAYMPQHRSLSSVISSSLDRVVLTDLRKLRGFYKAVKELLLCHALAHWIKPECHTRVIRLSSHECPVHSRYKLLVIKVMVIEFLTEEEFVSRSRTRKFQIGKSQATELKALFLRMSSETLGIKSRCKSDGIRWCDSCLGSRSAWLDSVCRTYVAPLRRIDESFNDTVSSYGIDAVQPEVESVWIIWGISVEECLIEDLEELFIIISLALELGTCKEWPGTIGSGKGTASDEFVPICFSFCFGRSSESDFAFFSSGIVVMLKGIKWPIRST